MNKISFMPMVVYSFVLCGCAAGEADFGDSTLETTVNPINRTSYKLLGTYYINVENSIVISFAKTVNNNTGSTQASITVSTDVFPTKRRFLYLHKSPLIFSDTGNLSVGSTGLLSAADVQSQQDLTSVLSEIAKTAIEVDGAPPPTSCLNGLPENWQGLLNVNSDKSLKIQADAITQDLNGVSNKYNSSSLPHYLIKVDDSNIQGGENEDSCNDKDEQSYGGFCVYEPTPIKISMECRMPNETAYRNIIAPIILNVYKYSHKENPQRGFFTSPHDSYVMQDGMIVGHKYSSESYVKGFFDFITTPIRSALPSTQTSTQIQTGGGKPNQTTNTTTLNFNPN